MGLGAKGYQLHHWIRKVKEQLHMVPLNQTLNPFTPICSNAPAQSHQIRLWLYWVAPRCKEENIALSEIFLDI